MGGAGRLGLNTPPTHTLDASLCAVSATGLVAGPSKGHFLRLLRQQAQRLQTSKLLSGSWRSASWAGPFRRLRERPVSRLLRLPEFPATRRGSRPCPQRQAPPCSLCGSPVLSDLGFRHHVTLHHSPSRRLLQGPSG